MKVFIIRHGESETNRDGLWTGWLDAPLTEKGRAEAALLKEFLSRVSFDRIYSSDLVRATTTADIAIPDCRYEKTPQLREINVGNLAGTPLSQKINVGEDGYSRFFGESRGEFVGRVEEFMHKLECLDSENVAIFSHAGWLRSFLDIVLGVRLSRKNVCCKNCAVAVFEYSESVWKLYSLINSF